MWIPRALDDRSAWLHATLDRLRRSLDSRRSRYGTWRTWYLHGAAEWGARYNKIQPQLNTLAATLYAPRAVRFALETGPIANPGQISLQEAGADRLRSLWSSSGADDAYAAQTLWSLVYGADVLKFLWRDHAPCVEKIAPGDFGVWRDDLPGLEGQQAILHVYRLDAESVRAWLISQGMPPLEAARWLTRWGDGKTNHTPAEGDLAIGAMNPISWSGAQPTGVAGGVTSWGATAAVYSADESDTLEVEEVWARDDATADWRIFQIIERDLIVSDRANDYLPHCHPFVSLSVDPVDNYFWGYSLVAQLIPLQAWREKRMNQLDRMFARQAAPPMVLSGFTGVTDEKAAGIMRRGGLLSSAVPGSKVDLLAPSPNELSFQEISEIDMMFSETLGVADILQGGTSGGARGGAQAKAMMGAAAGRLTRRMMRVERSVAEGASLMFHLARRYDPTPLVSDEGDTFTLAMIDPETRIDVAAHSSSPVFAEQAQSLALSMFEAGIADKTDYLDLADPPMAQSIKQRMKRREKQEQQEQQELLQQVPAQDRAGLIARLFGGRKRAHK